MKGEVISLVQTTPGLIAEHDPDIFLEADKFLNQQLRVWLTQQAHITSNNLPECLFCDWRMSLNIMSQHIQKVHPEHFDDIEQILDEVEHGV